MIEVKEVEGRYEVFSPGRHWEAFEGRLSAHAAALGLAHEIRGETGIFPEIKAPWPIRAAATGAGRAQERRTSDNSHL